MLKYFLIGFLLIGLTVSIHATGTSLWMRRLIRQYASHEGHWIPGMQWWIFVATASVLLTLHILEILLWSLTYLWLPEITYLETFESALYFSLVTFTTLGYGDITLQPVHRILSGIEAMTGIFLFGWSTALFFAVVQRSWRASFRKKHHSHDSHNAAAKQGA